MKVLIVSPCDLPVPAVKGGAVATLIESLVIQNEIHEEIDLNVISLYDSAAYKKSKNYANTKFIYFKENKILKIVDELYEIFCAKILKKPHQVLKRYMTKICILICLKKELKKNNYDKVVLENSGYLINILKNKKIASKYKDKMYYHVHNDIPDNIYIEGLKKCKLLLISEYLKKKIIKFCGSEINNNIYIVKNGIDCQKFCTNLEKEELNEIKNRIKLKDEKIIIFVGRIVEQKGIQELTQAFMNLNLKNTILLVVGSHNFATKQTSIFELEMKSIFEKLGNKVIFTGYVPYEEIWKYYKIANLAVLPSTWEEPAGLAMLEAIVAGVPLITTKSGGIPEYIPKDNTIMLEIDDNLVVNIEKSIKDFFYNEEMYKELAYKAKEYVCQRYSEKNFYYDFIASLNQ